MGVELVAPKPSSQYSFLTLKSHKAPQSHGEVWRRVDGDDLVTDRQSQYLRPEKSRPPGFVRILSAQAAHHLRLAWKTGDHLAGWADANSHAVAGLLRVSVVLCAAQW